MKTRGILAQIPRILLLLAVAAAGDAGSSMATASDAAVGAYFRSLTGISDEPAITNTANTRGTAGAASSTAAATHAYAARARFNQARAAMERGLLLRDAAPKANTAALESAMTGLLDEMNALATSRSGSTAAAKK